MKILWDENKRKTNILKHGLDFADFTIDMFVGATINSTKQGRMIATFNLNSEPISIVFKIYGIEAMSLISMRPASKNERKLLK